jgi:hypothetical protein
VLGRLQLGDLTADRGEQRASLAKLALDVRLLRAPLRDDPLLLGTGAPELRALPFDERAERAHLADHLRVLRRDAAGGVEAVEDLVEVLRAEDDVERRAVRVGRVDRDETRRERGLRVLQVRRRDLQVVAVLELLPLDLAEAPGGAVVGLDRPLELIVDLADLRENLLGLRALASDGAGIRRRRADDDRSRRKCYDDAARLSLPGANPLLLVVLTDVRAGGPGRHEAGRLPSRPDGRNRQGACEAAENPGKDGSMQRNSARAW